MGTLNETDIVEARCFGCGKSHFPRSDFDLLCDNCAKKRTEGWGQNEGSLKVKRCKKSLTTSSLF